ncbi:MAG: hypothetical protein Q8K58_09480 [Acidimicrobiales bacterium]|nr:hypothetical protein [Acidimicrobiales bacterium]
MTSPAVRLALAASWRGGRADRRRAATLSAAVAVVTLMGCGCASAWALAGHVQDRAAARSFAPAAEGAPAAFERSALYDETPAGEQIYVYWWRQAGVGPQVPGVHGDPAPGSWFVSPALAERLAVDPGLASRYPGARPLADEGVAHPGELLAHRFVGDHVALDERLAADTEGWIGDGTEALELFPIAMAALALVGIPGLGLVVAASSPLAATVERRRLLLRALGASPGVERRVVATHALSCALPGALAAAVLWWHAAPRLTSVPFVGRAVFAGDLALSGPAIGAVAAGALLLAIAVASVRPGPDLAVRPAASTPRRASAVRGVPLLLAVVTMAAAGVVGGRAGARLFVTGVVATAAAAVIALPYVVDRVGAQLARHPGAVTLLVGRRMGWNAARSTRSLLAVGGVAALSPVVGAWVTVARDVDQPSTVSAPAVEVRGVLSPEEVADLARRADAVTLELVVEPPPDDRTPPRLLVVGDCRTLGSHVKLEACAAGAFSVPAGALGIGPGPLAGSATRPTDAEPHSTLFISDDPTATEALLRAHVLNADRPGRQVAVPGRELTHESPLVQWILGAGLLAGVVGVLALALHLSGQAADLARSRIRLVALGADRALVRRLAGVEAALSLLLVGLGCATVGTVSSWLFVQVDGQASLPIGVIALVVAGVLAGAALSGAAAGVSVPTALRSDRG